MFVYNSKIGPYDHHNYESKSILTGFFHAYLRHKPPLLDNHDLKSDMNNRQREGRQIERHLKRGVGSGKVEVAGARTPA